MKRPNGKSMTLETALWDTYERIWSRQKSAGDKRYMVAWLARDIGDMLIKDIDYYMLVMWTEGLVTYGNSPATVNRKLATISKALKECVKLGYLDTVPPMPHQREPKGKVRYLKTGEELALRLACQETLVKSESDGMLSLISFLVDTGARLSEALKVKPVGTSYRQVTFEDTKSGTNRTVPLTVRAAVALRHLPAWEARKCIRLFTRVRNWAGLPDVTLHTLRHTCASRLVQGGMDLYRVKTWLGHSTITTTERYAHLAPTDLLDGTAILAQNQ